MKTPNYQNHIVSGSKGNSCNIFSGDTNGEGQSTFLAATTKVFLSILKKSVLIPLQEIKSQGLTTDSVKLIF